MGPKSFEQAIRCYEQSGLVDQVSVIEKQYPIGKFLEIIMESLLTFFILIDHNFAVAQQSPDYFKVHAGELPVKAFYGLKALIMSL